MFVRILKTSGHSKCRNGIYILSNVQAIEVLTSQVVFVLFVCMQLKQMAGSPSEKKYIYISNVVSRNKLVKSCSRQNEHLKKLQSR